MKLKQENHIFHNCNDEKMIKWASENIEIDWFYYDYIYFGCSCDGEYGNYDFEPGQAFQLRPEDDLWEEWMNEISEEQIMLYRCSECEEWAIDGDW